MVSTVRGWPSPSTSPEAMEIIDPVDAHKAVESALKGPQTTSKKPKRRPQQRSPKSFQATSGLQFCTVSHPDDFRNPSLLRANRKHVMQDFLHKERLKSSSSDARAQTNRPSRKRRRTSSPAVNRSQRQSSSSLPTLKVWAPRDSIVSSASSVITDTTFDSTAENSATHNDPPSPADSTIEDDRQLIPGTLGRYLDPTYHNPSWDTFFTFKQVLGSALNAFNVWPGFRNPKLEIVRLKLLCNRYLGSKKLGQLWVPHLVKGRHSFVSTCAISSTYLEIMFKAEKSRDVVQHSRDREGVRHEVITMINESLNEPNHKVSDADIIAVLNILSAETMGCEDELIKMHVKGIHDMVESRGGLAVYADDHIMPSALTTTLYTIALLRESLPHQDFVNWAKRHVSKVGNGRPLPESPIFYRRPGFVSVRNALPASSPILALLNDLRDLTDAFNANGETSSSNSWPATASREERSEFVATLCHRIFSYPHYKNHEFGKETDQWRYEAIRLTASIYAFALSNRLSFSRAAQLMTSTGTHPSGAYGLAPLPVQIKSALLRSDLSDCWGPLSGVMLWLTLVAGAAANVDNTGFHHDLRDGTYEEARRILSALAMRTSILLMFEHSSALVETVRTMGAIQQSLIEIEEEPQRSPPTFENYANEFRSMKE